MLDSQIFDRLKLELGLKRFNDLVKDKLYPIPLDLVSLEIRFSEQDLTTNTPFEKFLFCQDDGQKDVNRLLTFVLAFHILKFMLHFVLTP